MLKNPEHRAKIIGEVSVPFLSKEPLKVREGVFQLFIQDPENVGTRKMLYCMQLDSVEGKRYVFDGFKQIHNDPGADIWEDTTTLFITIYNQEDHSLIGKGTLKILPADFMHQLTTIRILRAPSPTEELVAIARFGQFFAGILYQTYGGIFAKPMFFN